MCFLFFFAEKGKRARKDREDDFLREVVVCVSLFFSQERGAPPATHKRERGSLSLAPHKREEPPPPPPIL